MLQTSSSYLLDALAKLRRALDAAKTSGFLNDRSGGQRLTEACRRLIVRHPEFLATDDAQAPILDLLDALVEAEWPEAGVLATQLADI